MRGSTKPGRFSFLFGKASILGPNRQLIYSIQAFLSAGFIPFHGGIKHIGQTLATDLPTLPFVSSGYASAQRSDLQQLAGSFDSFMG